MVKDNTPGVIRQIDFWALLLALSGFILILSSLPGIGISADSITYTSVSRNLNHAGVLRSFDRDVFVDFPVGYPLFLAGIQKITGLDPLRFGLILNGVLLAAIVYAAVRLLAGAGMDRRGRIVIGACIVASPALLEVFEMLWSETLFIVLIVWFIWGAVAQNRRKGFWIMVAAAGCSAVVRYAGVTLIATGALLILWEKGLKKAILYGLAASIPLVGNLVRNRMISGTITGDRQKNLLPLWTHLQRFGGVLCEWAPPLHRWPVLFGPVAVLAIAALAGTWAYWWFLRKKPLGLFPVCVTFAGVYTVFILGTAMLTAYEGLDTRLLAPLYIPALIGIGGTIFELAGASGAVYGRAGARGGASGGAAYGGASGAANGRAGSSGSKGKAGAKWWAAAALLLLLAAGVAADARYLAHPDIAYRRYVRYDIGTLRHSPTLDFINKHPELTDPNTSVYTNAPDILYLLTRRAESDYLPDGGSEEDMRDYRNDRGAYVVWIDACLAYPRACLDSLKREGLDLIYTGKDGAVYIHR